MDWQNEHLSPDHTHCRGLEVMSSDQIFMLQSPAVMKFLGKSGFLCRDRTGPWWALYLFNKTSFPSFAFLEQQSTVPRVEPIIYLRRITFGCLLFWSSYKWAPAWDSWFILHHTGADLLVRIQAWDVNHRHWSLHVPDVPPLDRPVLAAGHHLCPRLGGCPHAAVHWVTVTLVQGRGVGLTGPGITLPALFIIPLSG